MEMEEEDVVIDPGQPDFEEEDHPPEFLQEVTPPQTSSPSQSNNLHQSTVSNTLATTLLPKEVRVLETAEDIQERREQVLGRYSNFKTEVKLKREKLEDSRRFQYFKRDADELESWIYEKLQAASDETFKDATNLQAKIQKHQVIFYLYLFVTMTTNKNLN